MVGVTDKEEEWSIERADKYSCTSKNNIFLQTKDSQVTNLIDQNWKANSNWKHDQARYWIQTILFQDLLNKKK